MFQIKQPLSVCGIALVCAMTWGGLSARADHRSDGRDDRGDRRDRKVFVVAMENHNWTQPASTTNPQPIFQNPAAPFVNSLVDGTSGISEQVAYATNYLNAGVGVHPSEPNYIWAEAGQNFGVFNDDNPYHADCSADSVQTTDLHLSAFLTRARRTWRSYQEDTNDRRRERRSAEERLDGSAVQHQRRIRRARTQRLRLFGAVQLRRQAQPDGLLHRHQRRL